MKELGRERGVAAPLIQDNVSSFLEFSSNPCVLDASSLTAGRRDGWLDSPSTLRQPPSPARGRGISSLHAHGSQLCCTFFDQRISDCLKWPNIRIFFVCQKFQDAAPPRPSPSPPLCHGSRPGCSGGPVPLDFGPSPHRHGRRRPCRRRHRSGIRLPLGRPGYLHPPGWDAPRED